MTQAQDKAQSSFKLNPMDELNDLRMSEKAQKLTEENETDEERAARKKRAQDYRDQIKKEDANDENDTEF